MQAAEKLLETYYSDIDIVLIEGWISGPFPKIEVWRKYKGLSPLFPSIKNVQAIVSDDEMGKTDLPVFLRSEVESIINFILVPFI